MHACVHVPCVQAAAAAAGAGAAPPPGPPALDADLARAAEALAAPAAAGGIERQTAPPAGSLWPQEGLFSGAALVSHLQQQPELALADRAAALALAQRLVQANVVNVVSEARPSSFLVADDSAMRLRLRRVCFLPPPPGPRCQPVLCTHPNAPSTLPGCLNHNALCTGTAYLTTSALPSTTPNAAAEPRADLALTWPAAALPAG